MARCKVCKKYAIFGSVKPTHCKQHKGEHMTDVANKRCHYKPCTLRASFGFEDTNHAIFCKLHSMPVMVNVISSKCKHPRCNRRSMYGYTKARYCSTHAGPNMVNHYAKYNKPRTMVKNVNRRLRYDDEGRQEYSFAYFRYVLDHIDDN